MSYPGSNVTFNLYDVNPPAYPIGMGKPANGPAAGENDVLRPRSPLGAANSLVLPPSSKSPSSTTIPLNADSAASSTGAGLKKSQSLRVPDRTVAPLAIPTSSRDDSARPASSAHPGSLHRSQTALSPLSASASSNSGSQSAGGLLGSSNPFNDLSSSLQIPSFRPNLSRMGRKISEFGKEVFSLEEEPELPSRARTPGVGGAAVAALGGEKRVQPGTGFGGSGDGGGIKAPVPRLGAMAPPLVRSGTAPVPLAPASGTILTAGTSSNNPPSLNRSSTSMVASASQPANPVTRPAAIPEDVPGMGDEPIMCPFCDKPLPPPLIISQLAHLHAAKERGKRASEATLVDKVDKVDKGSEGVVKRSESVPAKPTANASGAAAVPAKEKGEERATAESFLPVVKMSEAAERAANDSAGVITEDQIKEWSRRAGIKLEGSEAASIAKESPGVATPAPSGSSNPQAVTAPTPSSNAFPLLPPPPPPASRIKSPNSASSAIAKPDPDDATRSKVSDSRRGSRFGGLFGKKGSKADDDDEEESDDEYAQGGYAKLSGPASPERVENRRLELEDRRKSPVGSEKGDRAVDSGQKESDGEKAKVEGDAVPTPAVAEGVSSSGQVEQGTKAEASGDQDDLKAVLKEVLDKVNMMTKSHTELATSHNSLLTSLKIARSNLVMAEANAEMLEEQLRKASTHQPVPIHTSAIPPRKSSAAVQDGRRSLEETRKPANPIQAVQGASKPRPNSLIIPASALFETGPMTGPASSRPSMEAASKAGNNSHSSGGVFGGFFGGKTLGSLNIPTAKELQASAVRLGDSLAGPSRPGTPINGGLMLAGPGGASGLGYAHAQGNSYLRADHAAPQSSSATSPAQFFDYHMPSPPTSHHPSPNPDGTGRVVSGSGSGPGSGHGASPSNNATPLARPALSPANSGQFATEFAKLRTAYASSQTKMEAMAKELADLKKGKIEMEAELETLSQALFEEANKMVADERRKRLESEEMLKEVKEEKEVLKETIKVLGGKDKVPEVVVSTDSVEDAKEGKKAEKADDDVDDEAWKPRDLDKHYEALRKTIHHVADGASPSTAVLGDGGSMLADAVNYSGASREFEAALDEVQAAAEAEGVLGFTPVGVNPVLELSPVLPKETREAEVNPWAEIDFSGTSASTTAPRKTSHGYGVDPLEGRRESLGLNLRGVDFGEGLDGSAVIEPPTRQAVEEEPNEVKGSVGMRRTSTA